MATEAISAAALPDDALASVLGVLPPQSLAVARCVCKAWRDIIDGRALLLPHFLPRSVRGAFINYINHERPHFFARPASSSTFPRIDGLLSFMPNEPDGDWWKVLDHCNGLLLCNIRWGRDLLVCNPATQRWTMLPSTNRDTKVKSCAYIAFDPMVSLQYEVFLIPEVPRNPASPPASPVYRKDRKADEGQGVLSIDEGDRKDKEQGALSIDDEDRTDSDRSKDDSSSSIDEEDQTDKGRYQDDDDPCRLMEWPPSQWSLKVFSSSTSLWEDRIFVREGQPVGTVEEMRLDPVEPTWHGPRQRYAVCQDGGLYVHCQGSFVARFSLSTDKYQVIKMPTTGTEYVKPYLGGSKNAVYFGIVTAAADDDRRQLRVWMLSESCGCMEWLLKYEVEIGLYAIYLASMHYKNGRHLDGSWMVEEDCNYLTDSDGDSNTETKSEECHEWDSDNDDNLKAEAADEFYFAGQLNILGFHPYKEVVFFVGSFGVASYHFSGPRIQYLGNPRPRCYNRNYTNDIYESFIYTPCMIGDLLHGEVDTGDTRLCKDEH